MAFMRQQGNVNDYDVRRVEAIKSFHADRIIEQMRAGQQPDPYHTANYDYYNVKAQHLKDAQFKQWMGSRNK